MRGSPLIRAVLVIAALLLALIPLWKLTHAASVVMAPAPKPANVSIHMELTFSQPASSFQVLYLGKVIWNGQNASGTVQKDVDMHFPQAGIDLQVKAAFAGSGGNSAVRVVVSPAGQDPIDKTAWGENGNVDDVLTFQEKN